MNVEIIGLLAVAVNSFIFLPQIIKIIKTKIVHDLLLNKVGKNKTHEAVIDFLNSGAFKDKILKTKIPLSTVKQKETMLMKFNSITLKNPIAILVKELIEKGVL